MSGTMTLGDVRIRASSILEAMDRGNWCSDYSLSVRYYLRHRDYVTIREAVEDFPEGEYELEATEEECPTCGHTYTPAPAYESNPGITISHILTLFESLRDEEMEAMLQSLLDLGCEELPLDLKVERTVMEDRHWCFGS